jgi:hypothetical protein
MFKKKSIFWDLPYWQFLDVRRALDGMDITKNVIESLLDTLIKAKGKGKDSLNTRLDLKELKVSPELHPKLQPDGTKTSSSLMDPRNRGEKEAPKFLP